MENIALELKNIDYSYGKKRVLNNISFCIKEGTFSVLLGLNGAGKSTIFSLIIRLQSKNSHLHNIYLPTFYQQNTNNLPH